MPCAGPLPSRRHTRPRTESRVVTRKDWSLSASCVLFAKISRSGPLWTGLKFSLRLNLSSSVNVFNQEKKNLFISYSAFHNYAETRQKIMCLVVFVLSCGLAGFARMHHYSMPASSIPTLPARIFLMHLGIN